jgi:hypothetical protein
MVGRLILSDRRAVRLDVGGGKWDLEGLDLLVFLVLLYVFWLPGYLTSGRRYLGLLLAPPPFIFMEKPLIVLVLAWNSHSRITIL